MLFTVPPNLKHINLHASDESCIFTFDSCIFAHRHMFLQNPRNSLVTPATLHGGYTEQNKTEKDTDGDAPLCNTWH